MQMQSRLHGLLPFLQLMILLLGLTVYAQARAIGITDVSLHQAAILMEGINKLGEIDKQTLARPVYSDDQLLGYIFLTNEVAPIPAYSGKPVAVLVGVNLQAKIEAIQILEHEEPILVIGVTDKDLNGFTQQYQRQSVYSKVRIGAHSREGYIGIDGISGATITAMVLNRSIMRSAQRISQYYELPRVKAKRVAAGRATAKAKEVVTLAVAEVKKKETESKLPVIQSESEAEIADQPAMVKTVSPVPAEALKQDSLQESQGNDAVIKNKAFVIEEAHWFNIDEVWHEKGFELSVILAALAVLIFILFFQDWLVVRTRLFRRLRLAYLVFTVLFIGYYCMAQLSIMNVLAFIQLLSNEFTWETLMIDPLIFVLWGFVAVSIILWGRGVYCGWLCPFGAMQELIHKAAKRVGLKSYQFPQMVHERLWAIKYIVLILLVGVSLESLATASAIAEIEPFKTTFALKFQREWWFVAYAVILLVISAFNSKFFCKYLCPLGAGLSFATRFRVFDWLRRRKECGRPCQTCAAICQISAIKHTGEIIDTECHYCLECQVDYWDDGMCPPLIEKRKKRERRSHRSRQKIAVQPLD